MRLLIVEDNPKLAGLLKSGLEEQDYVVELAYRGHDGEELARTNEYDVIVLDVMLPDLDGVQLCRNLRRMGLATPILMLTALSSTSDKVDGLNAGADDYLTKPFEFDELVARVRALQRRSQPTEATVLRYGDVEMDLLRQRVVRDGRPIKLTNKEYALLEFFMRNPKRVLTRTALGEQVWDMNFEEESNVIEVYVSRLRSKIDKGFELPIIHTVVGTGYMLSAETPAK